MQKGLVRQYSFCDEEFAFDFCRKPHELFGSTPIDHWWMPVTPLYGQRQGGSGTANNRSEILRFFWAKVRDLGATNHRETQERLLLSSLLPSMRVVGSRRIFADAFLKPATRSQKSERIAALESQLSVVSDQMLTRVEFENQSWLALGCLSFPEGMQGVYDRLSHELLDEPCSMLANGHPLEALENLQETWKRFMQTIARRARHAEEKIALDVLSYEARTAFHDCYSAVWSALIPLLKLENHLTEASVAFLYFWHTALKDPEFNTFPFHGHVLGLHPGTSTFMQSRTGRRLLGDWLANYESVELRARVLNAILIALFDYRRQREEAAESRFQSQEQGSGDLEAVERIQQERRSGRR